MQESGLIDHAWFEWFADEALTQSVFSKVSFGATFTEWQPSPDLPLPEKWCVRATRFDLADHVSDPVVACGACRLRRDRGSEPVEPVWTPADIYAAGPCGLGGGATTSGTTGGAGGDEASTSAGAGGATAGSGAKEAAASGGCRCSSSPAPIGPAASALVAAFAALAALAARCTISHGLALARAVRSKSPGA